MKLATDNVRFASHLLFKMRHSYPFYYHGKHYRVVDAKVLGVGRVATITFEMEVLGWGI